MYSSFRNTSSALTSSIRGDIFSLLGNSGKTIFSVETVEFSFSFRFFFSQSLQKVTEYTEKIVYKKPLIYLIISIVALMFSPIGTSFAAETTDISTKRTFIITAYYSPILGQNNYYRGSYEADVRLNGQGIHGASGTPVFTGMIAAPKTYAFGTQIFFDGLGLGTVQDRGGAIVEAYVRGQAYDRLDIWMGYGDAALQRTIAWGRRIVQGTIVTGSIQSPIDLSGIDDGSINLAQYPAASSVSIGGLSSDIISAFADLGYMVIGNDTKTMIIEFQLDQKIISSKDDEAAGTYGPKTRAALVNLHADYTAKRNIELDAIGKARELLLTDHDAWQKKYHQAEVTVISFGQPRLREVGEGIRLLQDFLSKGKYYLGSLDGQMRPRTLLAIRKYQKTKKLKTTGKLDDATRVAMIEDIVSL